MFAKLVRFVVGLAPVVVVEQMHCVLRRSLVIDLVVVWIVEVVAESA